MLPIIGSWHVNLVLFCFDGRQVPQRCLVSTFTSSIKCLGLLLKVHAQGASLFWLSQSSRNFNQVKRNTRFIMSSIKCFDLSLQVHTVQALSGSNFFCRVEKASYTLLPVSQWTPRAEQESFAPNWFVLSVRALAWPTPVLASVKGCWRGLLVNLHAPTPFVQIGQDYLRRDLCEGILLHLR